MTVTGTYHRYGYEVIVDDTAVYSAGNHRQDSQQPATLGSPECFSLKEIRQLCIKTTKEIATEHNANYGGVERISENEVTEA